MRTVPPGRILFSQRAAGLQSEKNKMLTKQYLMLNSVCQTFFTVLKEQPALLHGDLWADNFMVYRQEKLPYSSFCSMVREFDRH
jgi:fructosamine-3-kinase